MQNILSLSSVYKLVSGGTNLFKADCIPRTRVRVPVEMNVFHISSIVHRKERVETDPWHQREQRRGEVGRGQSFGLHLCKGLALTHVTHKHLRKDFFLVYIRKIYLRFGNINIQANSIDEISD